MTEDVDKLSVVSREGIAIIGINQLTIHLWPEIEPPYMEQAVPLRAWMQANNAHYYARPKEEFSLEKAVQEAKFLNCTAVVLENLS